MPACEAANGAFVDEPVVVAEATTSCQVRRSQAIIAEFPSALCRWLAGCGDTVDDCCAAPHTHNLFPSRAPFATLLSPFVFLPSLLCASIGAAT